MPGDAPGRHESLLLSVPEMTIRVISPGTSCDISIHPIPARRVEKGCGHYLVVMDTVGEVLKKRQLRLI